MCPIWSDFPQQAVGPAHERMKSDHKIQRRPITTLPTSRRLATAKAIRMSLPPLSVWHADHPSAKTLHRTKANRRRRLIIAGLSECSQTKKATTLDRVEEKRMPSQLASVTATANLR